MECRKLVTTVGDACVLQSKVEPTWGRKKKQLESWKSQYQYLDCHKRKKDASDGPERTRKCKDWELKLSTGASEMKCLKKTLSAASGLKIFFRITYR